MPTLEFVPARMLIVDDISDNRAVLARYFCKRQFEVSEAESGAEALALVASKPFDIVLLDIMMPEMSGIGVLTELRKMFSPGKLPVIMVTARTGAEDVIETLDLGANDYLTKPVNFAVAFARVMSQLERKRAQDALEHTVNRLTSSIRMLENEILKLRRAEAFLTRGSQTSLSFDLSS